MGGPPGVSPRTYTPCKFPNNKLQSQVAPLPSNLPFRLVSKTIGSGAYASIKKAVPLHASGPVIAVKFINKDHAFRTGHLRPKQIQLEVTLHKDVCPHDNIIRFLNYGGDDAWIWLALELAEGGDLFDKIEPDLGVGQDIAHFYFVQLCSAIAWCHGEGVAHRDIKPENMLLSAAGDLKLADFGLATRFLLPRTGERKRCGMVCGSPPYIAPEILAVGQSNKQRKSGEDKAGYDPQCSDIWSCAIVLFVLLAGNTPWDSPDATESYEFHDYIRSHGRPSDELWTQIPSDALSLVRGMLKVDPQQRFTMDDVRKHLWFTRRNPHLNDKGKAANPIGLATQMLESLHIDFSAEIPASQQQRIRRRGDPNAMDIDDDTSPQQHQQAWTQFASTQPETPLAEMTFDWEAPPRLGAAGPNIISASQPLPNQDLSHHHSLLLHHLSEDPSMSQFTATPSVPLSLTQQAQQFKDIVPSYSLARFLSILPFSQLLPMLLSALHRLNIPIAAPSQAALEGRENVVRLRIKTVDARKQELQGDVVVERWSMETRGANGGAGGAEVLEVRFIKAKGDPLGWRRLFKQTAILCKDAIVKPS